MPLQYRDKVPPFPPERLESIAKVLGHTERGLTGPEIGHILRGLDVHDPTPSMTKWKRLYNAFAEFQNTHQIGNLVVVFIRRAMDPAKYTSDLETFHWRRDQLNPVLAFCGMTLGEDGQIRRTQAVSSIDQALERANRLQGQLRQRNVHADILQFCNAEIIARNYFHAVFEAMKSITAKIRKLSGFTSDGSQLVDQAFAFGRTTTPLLAINSLDSETLQGEQKGFISLLKGLYGTIRNPLAHNPKIEWDMNEQDALDTLTVISLVHRKLDKAYRYKA